MVRIHVCFFVVILIHESTNESSFPSPITKHDCIQFYLMGMLEISM